MRTCYPARLTRPATSQELSDHRFGCVLPFTHARQDWYNPRPIGAKPRRILRYSLVNQAYYVSGERVTYTRDDVIARVLSDRLPARLIYATALADLRGGDTLIPVVQGQIKCRAYGQAVHGLSRLSARLERALEALATI